MRVCSDFKLNLKVSNTCNDLKQCQDCFVVVLRLLGIFLLISINFHYELLEWVSYALCLLWKLIVDDLVEHLELRLQNILNSLADLLLVLVCFIWLVHYWNALLGAELDQVEQGRVFQAKFAQYLDDIKHWLQKSHIIGHFNLSKHLKQDFKLIDWRSAQIILLEKFFL